jgi:hypothetical protein
MRCPSGSEIQTAEECKQAGVALGGILCDGSHILVDDWEHTPCGCFFSTGDNSIHFDTGLENGASTIACVVPEKYPAGSRRHNCRPSIIY